MMTRATTDTAPKLLATRRILILCAWLCVTGLAILWIGRATNIDLMLADTANAWVLQPDGVWARRHPDEGIAAFASQTALMELAAPRPAPSPRDDA